MRNTAVNKLVIAALLCAIGIVIPMFSPFKIVLEPASFTLGSHIAIIIAMFISPEVAVAVALGTALGFFLGGFPLVIVMRAATHVIFALVGALILKKKPDILGSVPQTGVFAVGIAAIHALCEMAVVMPFYFGNHMSSAYYTKGFLTSVVMLVGVGTFVHSLVDFTIALLIWKPLQRWRSPV